MSNHRRTYLANDLRGHERLVAIGSALAAMLSQGLDIEKVSAQTGLSVNTVYQYVKLARMAQRAMLRAQGR